MSLDPEARGFIRAAMGEPDRGEAMLFEVAERLGFQILTEYRIRFPSGETTQVWLKGKSEMTMDFSKARVFTYAASLRSYCQYLSKLGATFQSYEIVEFKTLTKQEVRRKINGQVAGS